MLANRLVQTRNRLLSSSILMNLVYCIYRLVLVRFIKGNKIVSANVVSKPLKKQKLAIVGCGASINELSPDFAGKLADYDIVALSYAALLPIEIDFYFYEVPEGRLFREHEDYLYPTLSEKQRRGDIKNFLLKNPHSKEERFHQWFPEVPLTMTFAIHLCNPKKLERFIRWVCRLGLQKHFFFQSRASIFSICLWGAGVGYSEILLVGVDLKDTAYFYEFDSPWVSRRIPNPFADDELIRNEMHPTNNGSSSLSLVDAMLTLKSFNAARISVESPESLLASIFPVMKL